MYSRKTSAPFLKYPTEDTHFLGVVSQGNIREDLTTDGQDGTPSVSIATGLVFIK